jgi:putative transposase
MCLSVNSPLHSPVPPGSVISRTCGRSRAGCIWLSSSTCIHAVSWVGRIDQTLTLQALHMALDTCQPGAGLVHHTDRASQYAANDYRTLLKARGITCSMSRKANCWDNPVAESFFATLKVEFVHETLFHTRAQATREIFEYIEVFYNRVRRHSFLGYVSPMEFERNYVLLHQAA